MDVYRMASMVSESAAKKAGAEVIILGLRGSLMLIHSIGR